MIFSPIFQCCFALKWIQLLFNQSFVYCEVIQIYVYHDTENDSSVYKKNKIKIYLL